LISESEKNNHLRCLWWRYFFQHFVLCVPWIWCWCILSWLFSSPMFELCICV